MGLKSRTKSERRERRASAPKSFPARRATPWWERRPVLVGLFAVALATVAGYSIWARDALWYEASTATEAFLIPLGWMALIFISAAAFTGLLSGLLLPRPERVRSIGVDEDDMASSRVTISAFFQPRGLLVSLFFLGAVGASLTLAWSLSMVSAASVTVTEPIPLKVLAPKGRLSALLNQQELALVIRSRSEEPVALKAFFRQAADLGRPDELGLVVPRIVAMVDSKDDAKAAEACKVLASLGDRMNQNVRLLAAEHSLGNRWEPDLMAWLRGQVAPFLQTRMDRDALRVPILEALAWFQAPGDAEVLAKVFVDENETVEARLVAATGLGNMLRHEDLPALTAAIREGTGDQTLDLRVLWALRKHGEASLPGSFDPIPDRFVEEAVLAVAGRLSDEDPAIRCAAVVVLQAFQDARVTRPVTDVFETKAADIVCPRVEVPRPFGASIPFVTGEELRFKMLNLLASVAVDNRDLYLWLEQVSQQDRWKPDIREGMIKTFSGIEAHR